MKKDMLNCKVSDGMVYDRVNLRRITRKAGCRWIEFWPLMMMMLTFLCHNIKLVESNPNEEFLVYFAF